MDPSDSSVSLVPDRCTSLSSRPRPATAYGAESEMRKDSNRRHSAMLPNSPDRYGINDSAIPAALERPETMATPSYLRVFDNNGEYTQHQNAGYHHQTTLPQPRRSPSISHSIRGGVNELRSLGRRMSAYARGRGSKSKPDDIDLSDDGLVSPGPSQQASQPSQESPSKSKSRTWFRATHVRRRPSLPLLNHLGAPDPSRYGPVRAIPGSRHGPPVLPNDAHCGASARAAAAAQNEALNEVLESAHKLTTTPSLLDLQSGTTRLQLIRDSESGIDIEMNTRCESVKSNIDVIRLDPAHVLATELMEQVLCWLDPTSLLRSECVSQEWNVQARSASVWRHVFHREYRGSATSPSVSSLQCRTAAGLGKKIPDQDWRKMYLVRLAIDQRWSKGKAAAIYLNGHKDNVYCMQFDEHKIITGSRDRTIRVWDTHTYQCVRKIGPPSDPQERSELNLEPVNPQGLYPMCSITTSSPDPSGGHAPKDYHNASILCLQYDSEFLVTGSSDFTCIVWSIADNYKPIRRLRGHSAGVLDVCMDERYIVTCSKDTTIVVWDRQTGEMLKRLVGHRGPVNAVRMRGNLLASASGDTMSKLWNLDTGLCIKEFSSRDRGLACVEFSEDGRTIFAGGKDQIIFEYDTHTGTVVRQLKGHKSLVRSLHLDSANNRIVSGSYDGSVKVWDAKQGSHSRDGGLKINFEGWTTSWMLAAKSDYRKIVCTSQDGRVVIIDFGYGLEGAEMLEA